ncbi:hypothetical protein G5B37_04070 [Rasiella rasia]|uniref:Uncharacterized protein n=1 Tax=Rasiella rasia TaxID=2744027 RepID=A0A6G6GJS2_9FLAO|nr:hypothetical protein [Rasiella rasia]QIE58764.1 hypothetical protein G5B37_04070 [Rasiella rasia]
MNFYLIGLFGGIVLLILLTFIKKDSKYAKFGIKLKRVYCPNCNLKQPIMRKPANQRQALFGGYTCKNCGVEMDKYGTEIDSNSV